VLEIKEMLVCLVPSLRPVEVLVRAQVVTMHQVVAQVAQVAADKVVLLVVLVAVVVAPVGKVTMVEILVLV
jgi:hypothetical protein